MDKGGFFMRKFQVITDSTSDLEKEYREKYNIEYLKMVFTIDGQTYDADLDWNELSPIDYYNKMRNGNRSVTGLVKTSEVEEKFEKALAQGLDVLYIAISSKLSGSVNAAKVLSEELASKYPERKIVCFDSLRSNYAEGILAIDAAKLSDEGLSVDETVEILEKTKFNYQCIATVETLDYLKMAGRVKASTAFFGNLMGVKPLVLADAKGNNYSFKKVKGRKNSLDEIINYVKENITDASDKTIFVAHADCLKDAIYVKDQIVKLINPKDVHIAFLGPIIGATVGPGSIAISFNGKKVEIASGE
jgi:DegV family protein with EDD domain